MEVELSTLLDRTKTLRTLQSWYQKQLPMKDSRWRTDRRKSWRKKSKRLKSSNKDREAAHLVATMGKQTFSFKARRRLHVESPLVYKAKNDSTLSVPLPDYNELRTSKGRGRAVQAIRLYARENANNRNKPACYMLIPAAFTQAKKRSAEYCLGQEFGTSRAYLHFCKQHLTYAVGHFESYRKARSWCIKERPVFIDFV